MSGWRAPSPRRGGRDGQARGPADEARLGLHSNGRAVRLRPSCFWNSA